MMTSSSLRLKRWKEGERRKTKGNLMRTSVLCSLAIKVIGMVLEPSHSSGGANGKELNEH